MWRLMRQKEWRGKVYARGVSMGWGVERWGKGLLHDGDLRTWRNSSSQEQTWTKWCNYITVIWQGNVIEHSWSIAHSDTHSGTHTHTGRYVRKLPQSTQSTANLTYTHTNCRTYKALSGSRLMFPQITCLLFCIYMTKCVNVCVCDQGFGSGYTSVSLFCVSN